MAMSPLFPPKHFLDIDKLDSTSLRQIVTLATAHKRREPPGGEFKSTDKYPITQRGPFIGIQFARQRDNDFAREDSIASTVVYLNSVPEHFAVTHEPATR